MNARLRDWWSDSLWDLCARRIERGKRVGWIGWYAIAFDRPERSA
jgi:hypothetical protein